MSNEIVCGNCDKPINEEKLEFIVAGMPTVVEHKPKTWIPVHSELFGSSCKNIMIQEYDSEDDSCGFFELTRKEYELAMGKRIIPKRYWKQIHNSLLTEAKKYE